MPSRGFASSFCILLMAIYFPHTHARTSLMFCSHFFYCWLQYPLLLLLHFLLNPRRSRTWREKESLRLRFIAHFRKCCATFKTVGFLTNGCLYFSSFFFAFFLLVASFSMTRAGHFVAQSSFYFEINKHQTVEVERLFFCRNSIFNSLH